MRHINFLSIGDTTIDNFIQLKDAHVSCNINHDNCELCMKFGQKIPYQNSVEVPAVGNSANSAVCASRLGLKTALVSAIGNDKYGIDCLRVFRKEKIYNKYINIDKNGNPTNYHFVLSFGGERTILTKHSHFQYVLPKQKITVDWVYLSSIGEHFESFYQEIINWLKEKPETKLAFQPGTFQIKLGSEKLKKIYERTEIFFCNKEEAQKILNSDENNIEELIKEIHKLGPKQVIITDGKNGLAGSDGEKIYNIPAFPQKKKIVDLTGAGDATSATITVLLAKGIRLENALKYGTINAMSVIGEIGAQKGLLTQKEIERYI